MAYDVPVTVIIFNRPEITKVLGDVIRQVSPDRLFIISDGARKDHAGEEDKVNECRRIMEDAGKDSEIIRCYSDENMGCDPRIVSGLDLVFSKVDRSIILEDDCIPDISFFRYCKELLERYKDEERVMYVSGSNRTHYKMRSSYSFSYEASTWGWAAWSRSWKLYKDGKESWKQLRTKNDFRTMMSENVYRRFVNELDAYYGRKDFPWDAAWQMQVMEHNGLGVVPCVNMVRNIGYGQDATHTNTRSALQNWPVAEMKFPLIKPKDGVTQDKHYLQQEQRDRMYERICGRFGRRS